MAEVRPVEAQVPIKQRQFVDPLTGCLTNYGHLLLHRVVERTGGDVDDVWEGLGLGFQAIANQGRTDRRLDGAEAAAAYLESAVGGLRGDPRLQTADRALSQSADAMAVALSRASPDVARRVDEVERALAVIASTVSEIRSQQQQALRAQQASDGDATVRSAFDQQLQAAQIQRAQGRAEEAIRVADEVATDLANLTTTDVAEGTNLYFTDARADGRIAAAIGVSVQAFSANLDEFATVNPTPAGLALLDDADAAAQRTTLGLGTMATQDASAVAITGGSVAGMTNLGLTGGWSIFADTGPSRIRFYNGGDFATLSTSGWTVSVTDTSAFYSGIRTITATDSVSTTDSTILCDATAGAITVNLPTASAGNKRVLHIKKIDASANAVTIDPNGAETIDGAATRALAAQWDVVTIQSNGTAWFLI